MGIFNPLDIVIADPKEPEINLFEAEKRMVVRRLKEIGEENKTGKVWTAIFIESGHAVYLTNDDNMDGKPDGYIAITQSTGPTEQLLKLFGKSRVHESGREISVYVDGEKV